jgi:hypothetical protein
MPVWRRARAVKPMAERFPNPKPTQQHEKPIGPEQPVKETRKEKVGNAIRKAGDLVAPKVQGGLKRFAENAARSSGDDGSGGFHLAPPPDDMFSFQAPSYMMGMPGQPERPAPVPRRRKRKKSKPVSARRRQPQEQNWGQLGAVPDSVKRWMM